MRRDLDLAAQDTTNGGQQQRCCHAQVASCVAGHAFGHGPQKIAQNSCGVAWQYLMHVLGKKVCQLNRLQEAWDCFEYTDFYILLI